MHNIICNNFIMCPIVINLSIILAMYCSQSFAAHLYTYTIHNGRWDLQWVHTQVLHTFIDWPPMQSIPTTQTHEHVSQLLYGCTDINIVFHMREALRAPVQIGLCMRIVWTQLRTGSVSRTAFAAKIEYEAKVVPTRHSRIQWFCQHLQVFPIDHTANSAHSYKNKCILTAQWPKSEIPHTANGCLCGWFAGH